MDLSMSGEVAALSTAALWTITAMAFEHAGKRVGSLSLNLIRLLLGMILLMVFTGLTRGMILPLDAGMKSWIWLLASGFIGFFLGDLFLFQAFVLIGSRVSMLIYSAVPPLTAVFGFLILGEVLTGQELAGMAVTMGGISLVVMTRRSAAASTHKVPEAVESAPPVESAPAAEFTTPAAAGGEGTSGITPAPESEKRRLFAGVGFAFLGAVGQAAGFVLGKFAAPTYNAFAGTQIRSIAGIAGFLAAILISRRWHRFTGAFRDRKGMTTLSLGSFTGPFLGVSLSLYAVQRTEAGVASTIIALVPVMIILPAWLIFHERIRLLEVVGAVVAVGGTALMFW
ncbi:MAG: EamA family transporter [Spirochaetales bacterium]|nr:EamA family transporter [Spirochaetales bacterium]MCF7938516.1 EamA family transporter [Spirochaetales bacterium]